VDIGQNPGEQNPLPFPQFSLNMWRYSTALADFEQHVAGFVAIAPYLAGIAAHFCATNYTTVTEASVSEPFV